MDKSVLSVLRKGSFVTLSVFDGLTLSGYAAQDPELSNFIRLDGLVVDDEDGNLSQFSIRLEEDEIRNVHLLDSSPVFKDSDRNSQMMPFEFWSDV